MTDDVFPIGRPEISLTVRGWYVAAESSAPTEADLYCYLHPDGSWRVHAWYYRSEDEARAVIERVKE